MKQQAELLATNGHQVRVITGQGDPSSETYDVTLLEELHPATPINLKVKRAVDHGQTDAHFQEFTGLLKHLLEPHFNWADLIIDHGALTTHFNLALTRALHELADKHPIVAWAHDFTPTNKTYALPNPDHHPWSLMRTPHPNVTYVAVSTLRKKELQEVLNIPAEQVRLIPPTVDPADCLGLDPLFLKRLDPWRPLQRELVLFYPTKLLHRKNIELAFQMTGEIRAAGINAFLAVSGAPDPQETGSHPYRQFLEALPEQLNLADHACFLTKVFQDPMLAWQQMFRLADVILFPSTYEGFGLPVVEALLHRLPCWVALDGSELGWPTAHTLNVRSVEDALREARNLLNDPVHQCRREWFRHQDPQTCYQTHVSPLLEAFK